MAATRTFGKLKKMLRKVKETRKRALSETEPSVKQKRNLRNSHANLGNAELAMEQSLDEIAFVADPVPEPSRDSPLPRPDPTPRPVTHNHHSGPRSPGGHTAGSPTPEKRGGRLSPRSPGWSPRGGGGGGDNSPSKRRWLKAKTKSDLERVDSSQEGRGGGGEEGVGSTTSRGGAREQDANTYQELSPGSSSMASRTSFRHNNHHLPPPRHRHHHSGDGETAEDPASPPTPVLLPPPPVAFAISMTLRRDFERGGDTGSTPVRCQVDERGISISDESGTSLEPRHDLQIPFSAISRWGVSKSAFAFSTESQDPGQPMVDYLLQGTPEQVSETESAFRSFIAYDKLKTRHNHDRHHRHHTRRRSSGHSSSDPVNPNTASSSSLPRERHDRAHDRQSPKREVSEADATPGGRRPAEDLARKNTGARERRRSERSERSERSQGISNPISGEHNESGLECTMKNAALEIRPSGLVIIRPSFNPGSQGRKSGESENMFSRTEEPKRTAVVSVTRVEERGRGGRAGEQVRGSDDPEPSEASEKRSEGSEPSVTFPGDFTASVSREGKKKRGGDETLSRVDQETEGGNRASRTFLDESTIPKFEGKAHEVRDDPTTDENHEAGPSDRASRSADRSNLGASKGGSSRKDPMVDIGDINDIDIDRTDESLELAPGLRTLETQPSRICSTGSGEGFLTMVFCEESQGSESSFSPNLRRPSTLVGTANDAVLETQDGNGILEEVRHLRDSLDTSKLSDGTSPLQILGMQSRTNPIFTEDGHCSDNSPMHPNRSAKNMDGNRHEIPSEFSFTVSNNVIFEVDTSATLLEPNGQVLDGVKSVEVACAVSSVSGNLKVEVVSEDPTVEVSSASGDPKMEVVSADPTVEVASAAVAVMALPKETEGKAAEVREGVPASVGCLAESIPEVDRKSSELATFANAQEDGMSIPCRYGEEPTITSSVEVPFSESATSTGLCLEPLFQNESHNHKLAHLESFDFNQDIENLRPNNEDHGRSYMTKVTPVASSMEGTRRTNFDGNEALIRDQVNSASISGSHNEMSIGKGFDPNLGLNGWNSNNVVPKSSHLRTTRAAINFTPSPVSAVQRGIKPETPSDHRNKELPSKTYAMSGSTTFGPTAYFSYNPNVKDHFEARDTRSPTCKRSVNAISAVKTQQAARISKVHSSTLGRTSDQVVPISADYHDSPGLGHYREMHRRGAPLEFTDYGHQYGAKDIDGARGLKSFSSPRRKRSEFTPVSVRLPWK